ncbi:hypothetical protein G6F70_002997 [Rhizopus microsporus]|uniref:Ras-specific guanine nucleotide-releasing factor RalGPS1 n=2 Tax=Rhizopus TaxID=4842 RepID=A0A367KBS1_RHIAZ|nr:hypothetical protein G6F71_000468 [Rhizopus microsporus]RCH99617.1 Ras-specific guanine nucleotide-releasing factor RalGPS1 [Rhizopus azygosporus]KAG1201609.1 hypothetical protein G6F70_002997 [Rhizopus microsporus]KAG1215532.1 hypothetical protein G6F69_000889 [Rhizopus microsporus]KAG1238786.1 hypothetical protein G6F67_000135 [Rhizopus microsporus]
MEDESIEELVSLAIQLEEKGQIKDAYFSFTSLSQKAIQSLTEIKFVHSSIISIPKQHVVLLSAIRTCLLHIESIIESHSTISRQMTGESKQVPPPLPPKPTKIQKPLVPPKPARVSRPSSVIIKEEIDNNDGLLVKPRVNHNISNSSRPISLPAARHHYQQTNTRPQTEYLNEPRAVDVVAEGEVDPNYLVPAQTNAGDSLTPAIVSSMNTDHVPLIPAPPLLTTHRNLQAKLDDLEEKLRQCRMKKQAIMEGRQPETDNMTEESLDQMIAQYLHVMAEIKATLNGVRTIYMSAATIPNVLQFQAHIIAYQLTLIDASIFNAIPPQALLEHSSKHPHPRIVASTDFFNYITRFIEHSILLPQEASARAQHIHYWIKVASRCLDVNNYQTLKAIVSALNTPPVQRLKRTWSYIPKKSSTKLETLNDLMSEANNYGNYREHMGMVNTTVVNGKSVQMIRDEHFSRPTVPFLGTFIHDVTYLLAAFKSSPAAATMSPEEEPRIQEVLNTMRRFQTGPRYTPTIPSFLLKSSQKHHFRPAISNALHRGASRIQRMSGGNIFGFDSSSNSNSSGVSSSSLSFMSDKEDDEDNLEEQQKMATQYLLMRSWVSQNTVDELSTLREPLQSKSNSMYGSRSNSNGPTSSISMNRTSSMFSNTSSNVRFSTGSTSLNTSGGSGGDSRPASMDGYV